MSPRLQYPRRKNCASCSGLSYIKPRFSSISGAIFRRKPDLRFEFPRRARKGGHFRVHGKPGAQGTVEIYILSNNSEIYKQADLSRSKIMREDARRAPVKRWRW